MFLQALLRTSPLRKLPLGYHAWYLMSYSGGTWWQIWYDMICNANLQRKHVSWDILIIRRAHCNHWLAKPRLGRGHPRFQSYMIIHCYIWSYVILHGHLWSHMITYDPTLPLWSYIYNHIWSYMVIYIYIYAYTWKYMMIYVYINIYIYIYISCVIINGQIYVWSHDPTWPLWGSTKKNHKRF